VTGLGGFGRHGIRRRAVRRQRAGCGAGNPFAALGLPASTALTSDDVRAAWRRTATATHPDRPDGGDPAAFAAAAAAYTILRTAPGRGEALADLRAAGHPGGLGTSSRVPGSWFFGRIAGSAAGLPARLRRGRPVRLAARVLAAAAVCAFTGLAVGWQPATPAIITGAVTWLGCTGRYDLAPAGRPLSPAGRQPPAGRPPAARRQRRAKRRTRPPGAP
jgi:hypothetical protein